MTQEAVSHTYSLAEHIHVLLCCVMTQPCNNLTGVCQRVLCSPCFAVLWHPDGVMLQDCNP